MHSCPKKTSEAMFDWMATTALKTLINTIISTFTDIQEFSLGCLFLSKKRKFTPSSPHRNKGQTIVSNIRLINRNEAFLNSISC